jgi:hypothetical protein
MHYKHTQIGKLMITIMIIMGCYFIYLFTQFGLDLVFGLVSALVVFLLASFSSLTAEVGDTSLRIKFGYGIYRKKFLLERIESAKAVRNHWYYGWGIRYWMKPKMWIFNVSGFDAVELRMKGGNIYRIGTDEPEELEQAINQVIHKI